MNVVIKLSAVHVVPHIIADRLIATEPIQLPSTRTDNKPLLARIRAHSERTKPTLSGLSGKRPKRPMMDENQPLPTRNNYNCDNDQRSASNQYRSAGRRARNSKSIAPLLIIRD
ncbi:hypothetical protein BN2476_970030 [Paraburkholderia piptadeniae]|uniref:Uncharacterized protein n=1 Tax=Paraburkholderia piptadeniae TaxID=1701573 RepID=A0A1N7SU55_9BURK|nr:hypothetical protein BN2476_970030 [Paraburkholderia piptadeniae]